MRKATADFMENHIEAHLENDITIFQSCMLFADLSDADLLPAHFPGTSFLTFSAWTEAPCPESFAGCGTMGFCGFTGMTLR